MMNEVGILSNSTATPSSLKPLPSRKFHTTNTTSATLTPGVAAADAGTSSFVVTSTVDRHTVRSVLATTSGADFNETTTLPDSVPRSAAVGVAVAVSIIIIILLIAAMSFVIILMRRRRYRRREKRIVRIENPQYRADADDNNDVMIGVGSNSKDITRYASSSGKSNGKKRKDAPLPPSIYKPSADTVSNKSWDSLTKRKAPQPPRAALQLYERDSPHPSAENLTSVRNFSASKPGPETALSPVDDSHDLQTNSSHLQPLLVSTTSSRPTAGPRTDKRRSTTSPKKEAAPLPPPASSPRHSQVVPSSPLSSEFSKCRSTTSAAPLSPADADDNVTDDVTAEDVTTSLIGKKAGSNASLDSYDRSKNPFFADD